MTHVAKAVNVQMSFESIAGYVLLFVFAAGGSWYLTRYKVQRLEKNLNGIGAKLNQVKEQDDNRYQRVLLAVMLFVPEKYKDQVAGILKEERK